MTTFHPCFLIPCYNHGETVPAVIDSLEPYGFPIIVVDDGSEESTKTILCEQSKRDNVTVITLSENQGKVVLLPQGSIKRISSVLAMQFK